MSDMTMVERVARAIGEADKWQRTDDTPDYRAHLPAWLDYEADARAAIEAMREPTEEMLFAADWLENGTRAAWQAMIDAALSEQKP